MTSMSPVPQKNPTELLEMQVTVLNSIYEAQLRQKELLEKIQAQQARPSPIATGNGTTKIIDINMPFMALVGFLVKFSLASIPAAIIIAALWGSILIIMSIVFSTLGVGLSMLGGR